MGLVSGVGCVGAGWGRVGALEPWLRPLKLTLIFFPRDNFLSFWNDFGLRMAPFSEMFLNILCKRRFCQNQRFVSTGARFWTLGASPNQSNINTKTHSKKTLKIIIPTLIFDCILAPKNLPKLWIFQITGFQNH